jgi:hypothetical protein
MFNKAIILLSGAGVFGLSMLCLGMARVDSVGLWPKNWPKELESYRRQSVTYTIQTGVQEEVYEIPIPNAAEFARLWPALVSLASKGAPLRLTSVQKKAEGDFYDNSRPAVRLYCPPYNSFEKDYKEFEWVPRLPWPETIADANGCLPEYVRRVGDDGQTWEPATSQGLKVRARIEIELVADGKVIDLNRFRLPADTPILDNRTF